MSNRRRSAVLVLAAVILPLITLGHALAGGGFNPPPPTFSYFTSPNFTATIVLDPNGPVSTGAPATLTGTFGTIAIARAGVGTATSAFQVQPGSTLGELTFGCNLALTNARFVEFAQGIPGLAIGGPFTSNWLATGLTEKLFAQLGVSLVDQTNTVKLIPGVTAVLSQQCLPFPSGNSNPLVGTVPLSQIANPQKIKPTTVAYPDLTIPGNPPATQQWYPGFLVLQVSIGFWAAASGTPIP
jgi:hypothetical protein